MDGIGLVVKSHLHRQGTGPDGGDGTDTFYLAGGFVIETGGHIAKGFKVLRVPFSRLIGGTDIAIGF